MSESESPQAPWEVDIDTLVADRQAFSAFVYTPVGKVIGNEWVIKKGQATLPVPLVKYTSFLLSLGRVLKVCLKPRNR
jgi:hypothetical protein